MLRKSKTKMSDPHYRISPQPSRKKWLIFAFVALAMLLSVGGFFAYKNHRDNQERDAQKARDEAQITSSKDVDAKTKNSNVDTPDDPIKQDVPSGDAAISIDSITQSNGTVLAKATSSAGSGTCVFTYTTEGDRPVIRTTDLTGGSCSSNIPEVEFSRIGTWNLNVTIYIDGKKTEANQSVEIN